MRRAVDGIDHIEQFPCTLIVAQGGKCHRRPDGGVGILTTVLRARLEHSHGYSRDKDPTYRKRRFQQLYEFVIAANEALRRRPSLCANVLLHRHLTTLTSFASWNLSDIPHCLPNPTACHHRSSRGDTSLRPRHFSRCFGAACRLLAAQRSANATSLCSA